MAGTYKCIVTSIGGENSETSNLEVNCKYYSSSLYNAKAVFVSGKLTLSIETDQK